MFGFILALLYVAFSVISGSTVLAGIESTLPFLWVWYCVWGCLLAVFCLIVPIIGIAMASNGDKSGWLIFATTPIVYFILALGLLLQLCGVYLMDAGLENGQIINDGKFFMGAALLFVSLMSSVKTYSSGQK